MRTSLLCLVIAGAAFGGCSGEAPPAAESGFIQSFSLGELVDRMDVPQLEGRLGAGGNSTSSGETIRRRSDFQLTYEIKEADGVGFDEAGFENRLSDEIEKALRASDVRVTDGEVSGDFIHFSYSKEGVDGWIEVVGTRVEGSQYKLWGVIHEVARQKTQD